MGRRLKQLRNRVRALFGNDERQRELDMEIQGHIESLQEEFIQNGMTPEEALKAAKARFGASETLKEECRDAWGTRLILTLWRDTKFGWRVLLKNRYFTLAALLTFGLCIGANTAVFSILNTLVLKPLPFKDQERIVEIYNTYPKDGFDRLSSNPSLYFDYKDNSDAFSDIALVGGFGGNMSEGGSPIRVRGLRVTPGYFGVFRSVPAVGSYFNDTHRNPGQDFAIVLSYTFWNNRFSGDESIVGSSVMIDGISHEVVGVAPRELESINPFTSFYRSWGLDPSEIDPESRHSNSARLYARLKSDVSIAQAQGQIDSLDQRYLEGASEGTKAFLERTGHRSKVIQIQEERTRGVVSTLYMLQLAAIIVMIIGCVNLSNLLLVQSNARASEMGMRSVLGAGPFTLSIQLIVEGTLLSIGGCVIGVLFGWLGIGLVNAFAMRMLPPTLPLELDGTTLLASIGLAIVSGVFVSSLPIARLLKRDLVKQVKQTSRSASGSRSTKMISSGLVCGQMALTLVLLVGAGMLIHGFSRSISKDLGFDPENVMVSGIFLPRNQYQNAEAVHDFQRKLLARLRDAPGVQSVALSSRVPMQPGNMISTFSKFGYTPSVNEAPMTASLTYVSPGFFETFGIALSIGRDFDLTDSASGYRNVLVDQIMVDRYLPGEDLSTASVWTGQRELENRSEWPTIVGVVPFAQLASLEEERGHPRIYESIFLRTQRNFSVFIKSIHNEEFVLELLRQSVSSIDSSLPLFRPGRMIDRVDQSFDNRRSIMLLLTIFAGIALLLSSVGLYGTLAYTVSQQRREIGTRTALGASKGSILKQFIAQGVVRGLIGLSIGLVGAILLSRFMEGIVFEVETIDPLSYIAVSIVLFLVVLFASYLPARRAACMETVEALKFE